MVGEPNHMTRPLANESPPIWMIESRKAPGRSETNGTPFSSSRSSASFLFQKCGTSGVWSLVRMLISTKRRTPVWLATSIRLRLPTVSIIAVSPLLWRVYPAAVVITASAPSIARNKDAGSIMSPRAISTPALVSAIASDAGRTRARTRFPRDKRASTTCRPSMPVPPTTTTGLSLVIASAPPRHGPVFANPPPSKVFPDVGARPFLATDLYSGGSGRRKRPPSHGAALSSELLRCKWRAAINRNVRRRLCGELGARPIGMPRLELKSREPRHQVEFSRPDIAVWAAEELGPPVLTEMEVVGNDVLLDDVVSVQADVPELDVVDGR